MWTLWLVAFWPGVRLLLLVPVLIAMAASGEPVSLAFLVAPLPLFAVPVTAALALLETWRRHEHLMFANLGTGPAGIAALAPADAHVVQDRIDPNGCNVRVDRAVPPHPRARPVHRLDEARPEHLVARQSAVHGALDQIHAQVRHEMQEALEKRGITPLSATHEYICTAPVELPADPFGDAALGVAVELRFVGERSRRLAQAMGVLEAYGIPVVPTRRVLAVEPTVSVWP